ncbi:DUF3099 domain-containing protein [Luteimicrobium sp. NPDC057192]|uniref:DUF3099 domain-containing protein n=1 Tax=Luteimicrobium sp. NPDC057192 TaxID=3346042 RepID=UPI003638D3A2
MSRTPGHDPHEANDDEVVSITSAPESRHDEQSRRMRVYAIQMTVRVLCFVGAILVPSWPVRIVLIVGAVVLPYTAVIFANASGQRRASDSVGMEYRGLEQGAEEPPRPAIAPGIVVEQPAEPADETDDDASDDPQRSQHHRGDAA